MSRSTRVVEKRDECDERGGGKLCVKRLWAPRRTHDHRPMLLLWEQRASELRKARTGVS
jgi:hypothetical protein